MPQTGRCLLSYLLTDPYTIMGFNVNHFHLFPLYSHHLHTRIELKQVGQVGIEQSSHLSVEKFQLGIVLLLYVIEQNQGTNLILNHFLNMYINNFPGESHVTGKSLFVSPVGGRVEVNSKVINNKSL